VTLALTFFPPDPAAVPPPFPDVSVYRDGFRDAPFRAGPVFGNWRFAARVAGQPFSLRLAFDRAPVSRQDMHAFLS